MPLLSVDLDNLTTCNEASTAGVAATGSVAGGLEHGSAGDALADANPDWGQVCKTASMVLKLNIFDYRRR